VALIHHRQLRDTLVHGLGVSHEVDNDLLAGLLDLLPNLLYRILDQKLHVELHCSKQLLMSRVVPVLCRMVSISNTKC
jgi:hypothetical protein